MPVQRRGLGRQQEAQHWPCCCIDAPAWQRTSHACAAPLAAAAHTHEHCSGLASATPSLTHLAELLLGRTLRGADGSSVHDSVDDASAAMALVLRELSLESPTPPLVPPAIKVRPAPCMRRLLRGCIVRAPVRFPPSLCSTHAMHCR